MRGHPSAALRAGYAPEAIPPPAAAARGDSLGSALKTITLDDVGRSVTKGEKGMNVLFRSFFVRLQPRSMKAARQACQELLEG